MRICYFGTYEKNYPRNKNIIEGLKINKVDIIECHESLLDDIEDKINLTIFTKIKIVFRIIKTYLKLIIKRYKLPKVDVVVVGYIGQLDMFLARILFPTKKIFFNPMISLYDTMINDRQVSKNFLVKKFFYLMDKISCLLANKVIIDTPEHAKYFKDKFNLPKRKIEHVYIGADDNIFHSLTPEDDDGIFRILFYGKFTPLQGIEHLVEAANILKNEKKIQFKIIGTGQTYKKITSLANKLQLKNITFVDWVPFENLPKEINKADVCIGGHFGSSKKAMRVVANKVFQIIAMKKPIIISDSPSSISAGFIDEENCLFCEAQNPSKLASKILELKNDINLRKKIAQGSLDLFKNNFTPQKTAKEFKNIFTEYLNKNSWTPTPAYKIRKRIILDYLKKKNIKLKNFLEIGIGGGNLITDLKKISEKGEGMDISDEAIKAVKGLADEKIKIKKKNFLEIEEGNKYDLIISLELIEHLEDDKEALKKINQLLIKNGLLIISVPAHQKKWSIIDEWAGHYRRYEKKEIIKILKEENFQIKKVHNYGFPLLNILWWGRKKLVKTKNIKGTLEENTKRSGTDRRLEKRFKFFFNDFFILPFYIIQKIFAPYDLSPAYLIIAKKISDEN
jgi:glycosyltransferase involved in cell wall biosynthesis